MQTVTSVFTVFLLVLGHVVGILPGRALTVYSKEELAGYTAATKERCGDGMVIAFGGGFDRQKTFQPLLDRCKKHSGKDSPNVLCVPTAAWDNPDDPDERVAWFEDSGCVTDILYVSRESAEVCAEKIAWADIVYVPGGNLPNLMSNWNEKGVSGALAAAFDRGAALIGVSSGAMCWGESGRDDSAAPVKRIIGSFPFYGEAGGFEYIECTGILPFCIGPHFDNTGWRTFALDAMESDKPYVGIENGAALVFENGEYSVISDRLTPFRTAFLISKPKGLLMVDLKTNGRLAAALDGEMHADG